MTQIEEYKAKNEELTKQITKLEQTLKNVNTKFSVYAKERVENENKLFQDKVDLDNKIMELENKIGKINDSF